MLQDKHCSHPSVWDCCRRVAQQQYLSFKVFGVCFFSLSAWKVQLCGRVHYSKLRAARFILDTSFFSSIFNQPSFGSIPEKMSRAFWNGVSGLRAM